MMLGGLGALAFMGRRSKRPAPNWRTLVKKPQGFAASFPPSEWHSERAMSLISKCVAWISFLRWAKKVTLNRTQTEAIEVALKDWVKLQRADEKLVPGRYIATSLPVSSSAGANPEDDN